MRVCNQGEGLGQIVFAQARLEVSEPERTGVGLLVTPMHIETDRQAAERIQLRQQALKGGLAGRRKEALGIGPNAQGAALVWQRQRFHVPKSVFAKNRAKVKA